MRIPRILVIANDGQFAEWFGRSDLQVQDVCEYLIQKPIELLRKGTEELRGQFDFIIFYRENLSDYLGQVAFRRILATFKEPVGFIDQYDDPLILDWVRHPRLVYFKRELRHDFLSTKFFIDYAAGMMHELRSGRRPPLTASEAVRAMLRGKVRLLPTSISNYLTVKAIDRFGSPHSKEYKVSLIASIKGATPLQLFLKAGYFRERLAAATIVRRIPNSVCYLYGDTKAELPRHGLTIDAYAQITSKSACAIAPLGVGQTQTYRYWEIASLGAVPISPRHKVRVENDFVEGEEVLHYDKVGEIKEIVSGLAEDERLGLRIGTAARERYRKHHTPENRVKYLVHSLRD